MREDIVRWFVHVGGLIMTFGIPIAVVALAIYKHIGLFELAISNPLVIIPYAFVAVGWGAIWAIIAADWVWHGSLGIRRFVEEFIKDERTRKIVDYVFLAFIIIEGIAMVYSLVFVPI
ncbi:hypothetical protein [Vulcanisaeta thermophila]|uniref:hypothetical protein n=1 Tax=Vulcanisaeta thermophila TaxID=867917 RepID=UPI00085326E8|nr:hypothetical protein [Vulcanisaeta thermophila]